MARRELAKLLKDPPAPAPEKRRTRRGGRGSVELAGTVAEPLPSYFHPPVSRRSYGYGYREHSGLDEDGLSPLDHAMYGEPGMNGDCMDY